MRFDMNSALLSITQPCCYWVFDDFLTGIEIQAMEYSEERSNEEIEEPGQLALFGKKGELFKIRRKDLPLNHPEYACEEIIELDWLAARKIIGKCWLETLTDCIDTRYYWLGRKNRIKLIFKGVYSPKEYNFKSDACDFVMSIPKSEMNYIIKTCLVENREGFEEYLLKKHSSYDGYMSFMPNNIDAYMAYWSQLRDSRSEYNEYKHLIWVCLDYWLFGITGDETDMEKRFSNNQGEFTDILWNKVIEANSNGVFDNIMRYEPKEDEEAA